jgi:hypothetical protein
VKKLRQTPHGQLGPVDRLRRSKILMPFASLFYCLIIQRGIFDGWAGWYYALQRLLAETLLAIGLIEDEQFNPAVREIIRNGQNETEQTETA